VSAWKPCRRPSWGSRDSSRNRTLCSWKPCRRPSWGSRDPSRNRMLCSWKPCRRPSWGSRDPRRNRMLCYLRAGPGSLPYRVVNITYIIRRCAITQQYSPVDGMLMKWPLDSVESPNSRSPRTSTQSDPEPSAAVPHQLRSGCPRLDRKRQIPTSEDRTLFGL
jgi:hypothetical protein